MNTYDRREFLKIMGATGAVSSLGMLWPLQLQAASGKVVIVGGGFGGTTCARYLKRWGGSGVDVTLIERDTQFITCPFSNEVLAGDLELSKITHGYDNVKAAGVKVVHDEVTGVVSVDMVGLE